MLIFPWLLWMWAKLTVDVIKLPAINSEVTGGMLMIAGGSLMVWAMIALRIYGSGLPMNAYPPPVFVTRGPYRLFRHPVYWGFGLLMTGFITSPYLEIRNQVRNMCRNFIEVYVSTKLEICIQHDTKGQYAKAMKGEISDFTGISAPYFPSVYPEVTVDNGTMTFRECTEIILRFYLQRYAGVT